MHASLYGLALMINLLGNKEVGKQLQDEEEDPECKIEPKEHQGGATIQEERL
jgi:hypothetical protein